MDRTATERQACPFCLPAALIAQVPPLLPKSKWCQLWEWFVSVPHWLPGADNSVFGLHCIPDTVTNVAGDWEAPSSPGHSGGTWAIPTGNHELRLFGNAKSVIPSLGWKLRVVVTKTTHCTTYVLSGLWMLHSGTWFTGSAVPQPLIDEKELHQWAGGTVGVWMLLRDWLSAGHSFKPQNNELVISVPILQGL